MGMVDGDGNLLYTMVYEGYGAGYYFSGGTAAATMLLNTNPLGYRGYVMDAGTGLYYLQSRYYDPALGRFINADELTSTGQGMVGDNMFAYCLNNPVRRIDIQGNISEDAAKRIIQANAEAINAAGAEFGVDPVVIAGCIYAELVLNVDWKDMLFDYSLSFLDTSIGIGQIKVSTARMVQKMGYIEKPPFVYPFPLVMHRFNMLSTQLLDNTTNIRYVAAYLNAWQVVWADTIDISDRPEILATLYNLGERANKPNKNPQANSFGEFVADNYDMLEELINQH